MTLLEDLEAVAQAKGLVVSPYHKHNIERMEKIGRCDCDSNRMCMLATREDFDYVYSRFETLLRDIVKEGYAIVV